MAVIVNKWGTIASKPFFVPITFCCNSERCSIPKRCCSSITIKAKFLNDTFSCSKACVPIIISTSPFFIFSISSDFFNLLELESLFPPRNWDSILLAVSNPILILKSLNLSFASLKCWWAKISVGAMIAVWYPTLSFLVATAKLAIRATRVFPEPTSPSNNLFIGSGLFKSFKICQAAIRWVLVNLNGNLEINCFIFSSTFPLNSIWIALFFCQFFLCFWIKSWITKSSLNANLFLAWAASFSLAGKWIFFTASEREIRFWLFIISEGSQSFNSSANLSNGLRCNLNHREDSPSVSW